MNFFSFLRNIITLHNYLILKIDPLLMIYAVGDVSPLNDRNARTEWEKKFCEHFIQPVFEVIKNVSKARIIE